jgi:hypothetical protein
MKEKLKNKINDMQIVLKIVLIILNSILFSMYFTNTRYINLANQHRDGWVYISYCFFYDLFLIPVILIGIKEKIPMKLFMITFLLQNFIVFTTLPRELPYFGLYLNVFLIVLTTFSLMYKKTGL